MNLLRASARNRRWLDPGRAVLAFVTLGLAGGAAASGPVPERLRIELRPESEVKGAQVLLGDVAVLTTLDVPTLERLMVLPLGPAPRSGTPIRIERASLLRWIRARTGLPAEQIAWEGPDSAVVWTATTLVSGADVASRAAEVLREALVQQGLGDAAVGSPATPPDVQVPFGAVELRARAVPRAALRTGHPSVWVDVWVDGRFVRTVPVRFELAADARPAGAAAPKLAVRPLAPVPPPSHRVAPPLVRRGSLASLRSVHGRIALESRVEVLEDGRPGDLVQVKPPSSDAPVLARVVAAGVLEVQP